MLTKNRIKSALYDMQKHAECVETEMADAGRNDTKRSACG